MDAALYDEMYQLEQTYWWFAAKRKIVLSILKELLVENQKGLYKPRICDLGCGCGMMLTEIINAGFEAVGIDSNDLALKYCSRRGVAAVKGEIGEIPFPDSDVDAALLLDVLEHLSDEKAAIAEAVRILKPGGLLVCTVPAYSWLWTQRDVFHHHKRRYNLTGLLNIFRLFGDIEIIRATYMNTFLFPLAVVERLVKKLMPPGGKPTDLRIPPLGLNQLLKTIFAGERIPITMGIRLPFGLSILAVIRKR